MQVLCTTVVIVVAAVGMRLVASIHHQQAAIREIERLGGRVLPGAYIGPDWLRNALGPDTLRPLEDAGWVDLDGSNVTDADLRPLIALPKLEQLLLDDTRVGDSTLEALRRKTSLWSLSLAQTDVTDAGMVHIRNLRRLEYLSLDGTRVTDAGVMILRALTDLQVLSLRNTLVTDSACAKIQRALPGLTIIR